MTKGNQKKCDNKYCPHEVLDDSMNLPLRKWSKSVASKWKDSMENEMCKAMLKARDGEST